MTERSGTLIDSPDCTGTPAGHPPPSNDDRMRKALITGAGSGIGRAAAIALGNSGYALALAGRRRQPLEETAELTGAPETLVLTGDLSVACEAEAIVDAAAAGLGEGSGLDVLVNNAGDAAVAPIGVMTAGIWDKLLAANASSAAYCTIAAWRHLSIRGGVIVNVASMAVYDPLEGFMAYGAAKAAMAHLTVSSAKEGAPFGIAAFCLCPGAVETAMLRSVMSESAVPNTATLQPEEVAAVILACVRGERGDDNGRSLPILPAASADWWSKWQAGHRGAWLGTSPQYGHNGAH